MARREQRRRPALPDWHLWNAVVRSVRPLNARRARELAETAPPQHLDAGPLRKAAASAAKPLPAAPPRPVRPPLPGIEPNLLRRVSRGHVEIEATIDLHGMRQAEAHAALGRFLRARAGRGDRTVLVITGKGLGKTATGERAGVLRAMLPRWLGEAGIASLVAGWESAARGHGGEGAFYVRLRRPERPL